MAAKYRRIDPRIWIDEKFSRLGQDDKLITFYLLTAQCNRIGLFPFSIGKAVEELNMPQETFLKRFENVCHTFQWSWDKASRVLYLQTWWRYNPPENKNNVIGNLKDLADLPDNPFLSAFSKNLQYLDPELHGPFRQTLRERYPKRLASQDQDLDQKQDQDSFSVFWDSYPRKENKQAALKAWGKLKLDDELLIVILAAVNRSKSSLEWTDHRGKFIPHPAKWLNNRRWEDEPRSLSNNGNGSRRVSPTDILALQERR